MKIGYIRCSTQEGSMEAQRMCLSQYGVDKTYEERASGRRWDNRTELLKLLENLRSGDCVVIQRLDRLGRNLFQLHEIAQEIKSRSADLIIVDQNINTNTPMGSLLFNCLGMCAQLDRDLTVERLNNGKRATGNWGGRKPKLNEKQMKTILSMYEKGVGLTQLANTYGVSKMTIWRYIKKVQTNQ